MLETIRRPTWLMLLALLCVGCGDETQTSAPMDVLDLASDGLVEQDIGVDTLQGVDTNGEVDGDGGLDGGSDIEADAADATDLDDTAAGTPCTADTVLVDCPPGAGCVDALCAPCETQDHCGAGMLCNQGLCQFCVDDVGCRNQYGAAFECRVGLCANSACIDDSECRLADELCFAHRCSPCTQTYECQASPAYGAGYACLAGHCTQGECTLSTQCGDDRPICGQNFDCRGCQGDAECRDRFAASDGYFCDLDNGLCVAGECFPAGSACGTDGAQVCAPDFTCVACTADDDCVGSKGSPEAVCESGACELGCVNGFDCQPGDVCVDHRCVPCASNGDCAQDFGSAFLCVDGQCTDVAQCNDERPCPFGLFCDTSTRLCRDCQTDADCDADYICDAAPPAGTGRCQAGVCTVATQASRCADSHLCEDGACVPCDTTHPCPTGYVCDDALTPSACQWGTCTPGTQTTDCASSLCVGYQCGACTADADCGANRVCDTTTGSCHDGDCLQSVDCALGQVCTSRACSNCQNDGECLAAGYGANYICQAGACVQGCTSHGQCVENLCVDYRCKSCAADYECAVGGRASVCDTTGGVCVPGECIQDADCAAWSDSCNGGVCVQQPGGDWRCATTPANESALCEDGDPCTISETCVGGVCQGVARCTDTACETSTCDPRQTACIVQIKPSRCLIDDQCYTTGTVNPDNPCQKCESGHHWSADDSQDCTPTDDPDLACNTYACSNGTCYGTPDNIGGACDLDLNDCRVGLCNAVGGCDYVDTDSICVARSDPGGDYCVGGACVECKTNAQCSDGDPCTVNTCTANACVTTLASNGTACATGVCLDGACVDCVSDEDCACTGFATCAGLDPATCAASGCFGYCMSPIPFGSCTCDPPDCASCGCTFRCIGVITNCSTLPGGAACEAEPACTTERCNLGLNLCVDQCATDPECDDGNVCTSDSCVGGMCDYALLSGGACDDGNPCTTDVCAAGACEGTPVADGASCPGGVCHAGACVDCISDQDCGCTGFATPCTQLDLFQCGQQEGCNTGGLVGCVGTCSCGSLDQASCIAVPCCRWLSGCGGIATACASASDCGAQFGCSMTVCDEAANVCVPP